MIKLHVGTTSDLPICGRLVLPSRSGGGAGPELCHALRHQTPGGMAIREFPSCL